MRMRYHKNLQFLFIPLIPLITHAPPLLPRPAVLIHKLDLIIQLLGSNIHIRRQNGPVWRLVHERLPRSRGAPPRRRRSQLERPRDGGEAEQDEEEEDEGDAEADREEIRDDEIAEGGGGAPPRLPRLLGCGLGGGRGEERLRPAAGAAAVGECHGGGARSVDRERILRVSVVVSKSTTIFMCRLFLDLFITSLHTTQLKALHNSSFLSFLFPNVENLHFFLLYEEMFKFINNV